MFEGSETTVCSSPLVAWHKDNSTCISYSHSILLEQSRPRSADLFRASPELVVTNMTRRTITLISEEYATALTNFLNDSASSSTGTASPRHVPETPALGGDATATSFFTASDLAGRTPHSGALGSLFDLLGHRSSAQGPSGGFAAASPTTGVSPALSSPASPSSPSGSSPFVQSHSALPLRTPSLVSPHVQAILSEEFSRRSFSLKPVFIEAIAELMDEVEMTYRSVGEQSIDHIHSGYAQAGERETRLR